MIIDNKNKACISGVIICTQAIDQIEPRSVLDIGMFWKRIGILSRTISDKEIPQELQLDGVDFFPEVDFPAWHLIYNSIWDAGHFLEKNDTKRYDLAVCLGVDGLRGHPAFLEMLQKAKRYARYFLTEGYSCQWAEYFGKCRSFNCMSEQNRYCLIKFEE